MNTYSDEPVLVKPDAKSVRKLVALVALALLGAGAIVYIPLNKARMEKLARHAERGPRGGALVHLELDGKPHTLELTWFRNHLAPVLDPAPAEGVTLALKSRQGAETLAWNATLSCFGPASFEVNPYAHHKLSLRLEKSGTPLWSDTAWAYGIHDAQGPRH